MSRFRNGMGPRWRRDGKVWRGEGVPPGVVWSHDGGKTVYRTRREAEEAWEEGWRKWEHEMIALGKRPCVEREEIVVGA